jgi:predicted ATPase/DNA-binding SARP family transcriptional activator
VQYGILGPLEVTRAGATVEVKGPKQRALLIFLLLHANEVVSTDLIVDALWGGRANGGEIGTLRVHISNLRNTLEPDRPKGAEPEVLVTEPSGYLLRVDAGAIDAHRFEQLLSEGRRLVHDDPGYASDLLFKALDLWRGSALGDVTYESFAQVDIQRLEELRLSALEELNEARLVLGEHTDLVGELESQVAVHPLRERLWTQLMLALYRSGRQAEALAAYKRLSDVLGRSGLAPGPGVSQLEDRIFADDPTLLTPDLRVGRSRLPPAERTDIFGRSNDVAELRSRFAGTRLLTLTGAGGVGKTRLAQRLAWTLVEDQTEVWWVELSGLTDPGRIPDQIAAVGGLSQGPNVETVDLLVRLASTRELVIVLDSCEHLIDASAWLVDRLLTEAPGVRFITTTREPLQVEGEQIWRVSSLAVPDLDTPSDLLTGYPSVELFLDRTRARGVDIPRSAYREVADVCRRLDGIPLALELAAARTSMLTPAEIRERLDDRFSLLERGGRTLIARHRTMEAAIDWSFRLLDESDRRLLSRLAVFVAGFDRSAAREVCAYDPFTPETVEAGIEGLVEKSLVEPSSGSGGRRFSLTESVKAFAWDRLVDDPKELLGRHRGWALSLAIIGGREILADEDTWFPRLEAAYEDLRTAFDESLRRGEVDEALRLVGSLGAYFRWRRASEAVKWLEKAIIAAEQAPQTVRPETMALGLASLGPFLSYHNRVEEGRRRLTEAADLYTSLDHMAGLMWVHYSQSSFPATGDPAAALAHARAAADLAYRLGDPVALAYVLTRLAETMLSPIARGEARPSEELDDVITLCNEALAQCKLLPRPHAEAMAKVVLGHALSLQGNADEGLDLVEEGVRERMRLGLGIPCATSLISAGQLALRLGYEDRSSGLLRWGLEAFRTLGVMGAIRPGLIGVADALRGSVPAVAARILGAAERLQPPGYQVSILFDERPVVERVRADLGDPDFNREKERGGRLSPEEAIKLALEHL